MRGLCLAAAVAGGALFAATLNSEDAKPVRLVMMGDSVTASRSAPEGQKIPEVVEKALGALSGRRFAWTVVNAGVGSETAEGGLAREAGVIDREKPDVVTFSYGLNDAGRKDPKWFADRMASLVETAQRKPSKPQAVLLTTTPIDDKRHFYGKDPKFAPDGGDAWIDRRLNGATRLLAVERGLPLIDVHREFVRAPEWQKLLAGDGIHPTPAGNKLVGEYVARALAAWAEAKESPKSKAAQAEKSARAKLDLARKAMAAKKTAEAKKLLADAGDLCPWLAEIWAALDEAEAAGR